MRHCGFNCYENNPHTHTQSKKTRGRPIKEQTQSDPKKKIVVDSVEQVGNQIMDHDLADDMAQSSHSSRMAKKN